MAVFRLIAILVAAVMLASCKPGAAITCPTLKQYSKAFLQETGKQLDLIEAMAPNIVIMVNDYGVTRDSIRKCINLRMKSRE